MSSMPGVHDRHVHLGLCDPRRFTGTPVTHVTDLGWDPQMLAPLRQNPPAGLSITVAGRFHSAPGGYPSDRAWAPERAFRAVHSPDDAAQAVAEAAAIGASVIKVTLHRDFPVLAPKTLRALSDAAASLGLRTASHVEGTGMAAYALTGGVTEFVHIPWTESLDPGLLAELVAANISWVSTLAIHTGADLDCALDNGRRFVELGGAVHYGTDLGNGDLPVGLNPVEVTRCEQLGLHGETLRAAVCDAAPNAARFRSALPLPETSAELCAWYASATRISENS